MYLAMMYSSSMMYASLRHGHALDSIMIIMIIAFKIVFILQQSGDAVKGYTRSHGSKETEDGVNDSWEKSEPSKPRKPAWLYVLGPPVQVNGVAGSNQLSKIVEMKLSTHRISWSIHPVAISNHTGKVSSVQLLAQEIQTSAWSCESLQTLWTD